MPRHSTRFAFHLLLLFAVAGAPTARAGGLEVRALQRDGKPLVGAVVTADAESPALPPATPVKAIMDQIDLAFFNTLLRGARPTPPREHGIVSVCCAFAA